MINQLNICSSIVLYVCCSWSSVRSDQHLDGHWLPSSHELCPERIHHCILHIPSASAWAGGLLDLLRFGWLWEIACFILYFWFDLLNSCLVRFCRFVVFVPSRLSVFQFHCRSLLDMFTCLLPSCLARCIFMPAFFISFPAESVAESWWLKMSKRWVVIVVCCC